MMEMSKKRLAEFVRFCIVGALCTGIDVGIFYLVRQFAPYQIAIVSGYLISLVFNYFLTIYWTFRTSSSARNMLGVVTAHLLNLFVIRMGLMWFFVEQLNIIDSVAFIPTLTISVILNFIVIRIVVK